MTKINQITTEDVESFRTYPSLLRYQNIAQKSAIYPGQGTFLGLMYVNAKLNGEAGEFSENVGKALRDDIVLYTFTLNDEWPKAYGFHNLSEERRQKLILELGDVLWYVAAAAAELNMGLDEIAERNLQKLADRSARNALQGSGDDR